MSPEEPPALFRAPWEARAFAIVVALCRAGAWPWADFKAQLIAAIAAAPADDGTRYYERWLAAAERLLAARGLIAPGELEARLAALAAAQRPRAGVQPN